MTTASTGDAAAAPAGEVAAVLIDVPSSAFDATVSFWAAALTADADVVPGMPGGDVYVALHGACAVTDVLLQRIGDDDRPRLHLDVAVADRVAAVARAGSSGGTVRQRQDGWDVLDDPAGLPLCVGFEEPDAPQVSPREDPHGYLDAVSIVVPPVDAAAEVAFWSVLLGAEPSPDARPEGLRGVLRGARAVGGVPVGLEVRSVGDDPTRGGSDVAPGLHVQLSTTDVGAEADRLRGLGAEHVATIGDDVTLADPAGNRLRIVPVVD